MINWPQSSPSPLAYFLSNILLAPYPVSAVVTSHLFTLLIRQHTQGSWVRDEEFCYSHHSQHYEHLTHPLEVPQGGTVGGSHYTCSVSAEEHGIQGARHLTASKADLSQREAVPHPSRWLAANTMLRHAFSESSKSLDNFLYKR